ncbi:MAG: DUF2269 family protein [Rubrivivax sp.]|jgi:uncharacterized membrane protein|nr:DUF2269 domain-containing protein [Rubrivivax sp.]
MNGTVKVVHVLCACLFLGNVVVSGIWAAMAERTRNHTIIQFSNRLVLITDVMFTLTGALGVVFTGYLMSKSMGGHSGHAWIEWSYFLFGASGLIWALLLVPIQLRLHGILRRTTTITAEYLRLSRLWQVAGAVATALPLPVIYLMVTKAA